MSRQVRPQKVLMLHGYAQSDSIFSAKTGGLRKELSKLGYELYYPCAPVKIEREDNPTDERSTEISSVVSEETNEIDLYGWWIRDSQGEFEIPPITFKVLKDYILANGPFVGIIGFSQGAALAGYLCTNFNKLLQLDPESQPDLAFFISFSGFRLEPEIYYSQYDKERISTSSLHVIGELDTVVSEERTMGLYDAYPDENKTLLKHPGGHFVPNSRTFVAKVINWLKAQDLIPSQALSSPATKGSAGSTGSTGSILDSSKPSIQDPRSAQRIEEEKSLQKEAIPQLEAELLDIIDGLGEI